MKIFITGATSFIGQIFSEELLNYESKKIMITDIIQSPIPYGSTYYQNAETIQADLVEARLQTSSTKTLMLPSSPRRNVFCFGEADFELGYRVNLDATRCLLPALAKTCPGVRVPYASSEAVYVSPIPKWVVTEADIPIPEMSYGC